jgi:signal transduction histidine kinase
MQEVAKALQPQAETKGLALEVKAPDAACVIQAERQILSQIIMNLADKAIKFTACGQVGLELGQRCNNGQRVTEISIVDTGIGIRPEDQTRLFEAFLQIDASAAVCHEGTRLGLHLSQKLAALLGERISFRSTIGQGRRSR